MPDVEDEYQPESSSSSQSNEAHSQHQPIFPTCAAPTCTHCQAHSNGTLTTSSREQKLF
ncbi:hypothetical protein CROQUDRAFT_92775 [Cronartium quercuum f. sp. fusiforme G11]|uniref:Uncharacterized protein n=1 Tax=Cronartium quercuum f. sp. fusiforme G11 TaxID=708437 RepID=A0A9P6NIP1_9BASI|nr:hypothetical protein CROQUDRAFT_92775 [Cronartium quercuum f. sp. fusiforme G11]